MLKRILPLLILFLFGLILFIVTILILFPAASIGDFIVDNAKHEYGVNIKYQKIERVFPFGVVATGVAVTKQADGIDLFIDRLILEYKPEQLFTGKIGFAIDAALLGGDVNAAVQIDGSGLNAQVHVNAIRPELLPQARQVALVIPVALSGSINIVQPYTGCTEGTVVIDSDKGGSGHLSALGFGIDFGNKIEAGARVQLKQCRVLVKNLWLEGDNIVTRLKGEITMGGSPERSRVDLMAEVNEKQTVNSNRLLLSFLNTYKITNGYYRIKIGGTIARPIIRRSR